MNTFAPPVNDNELDSGSYDIYKVSGHKEIELLMRDILNANGPVYLYDQDGHPLACTQMLGIDPTTQSISLAKTSDPEAFEAIKALSHVVFVSVLHHVKVQCRFKNARVTKHHDDVALVFDLPEVVIRLQRRNFFRVNVDEQFTVSILTPLPGAPDTMCEVTDLSVGGCAIVGNAPALFKLKINDEIRDCELHLPGSPPIFVDLQIRSMTLSYDQQSAIKLGCMFVALTGAQSSLFQRFVTYAERIQRAKRAGL